MNLNCVDCVVLVGIKLIVCFYFKCLSESTAPVWVCDVDRKCVFDSYGTRKEWLTSGKRWRKDEGKMGK